MSRAGPCPSGLDGALRAPASLVAVNGWGRERALVLAFLAVVALSVALGRPPADDLADAGPGGAVYAADAAIGAEHVARRPADEVARRWPDGRAGRAAVAWVFAVLVAVSVATAGWRWVRARGGGALPVPEPGLRVLAARAPPAFLQAL